MGGVKSKKEDEEDEESETRTIYTTQQAHTDSNLHDNDASLHALHDLRNTPNFQTWLWFRKRCFFHLSHQHNARVGATIVRTTPKKSTL